MAVIDITLLLLASGAGRVLLLLVSPTRNCTWCKGTLRAQKHRYWGRAAGCPRCRVTGRHYRLGAVTVHRWRQQILRDLRERRDAK